MTYREGYLESGDDSVMMERAIEVCESFEGVSQLQPEGNWKAHRDFLERYFSYGQHSGEVGLYRNGFAYRLQATRGTPLRYFDGENLIDLGFGRDGKPVVAIGPMGPDAVGKVQVLAERIAQEDILFHVKKVLPQDVNLYLRAGFREVDYTADFHPNDLPDDVFPEVIIDIEGFDELSGSGKKFRYLRQRLGKAVRLAASGSLTVDGSIVGEGGYRNEVYERGSSLVNKMSEFLQRWSSQKVAASGGTIDGWIEPYLLFLQHMNHLGNGLAVHAMNEKSEVVAFSLMTELSRSGYGMVMNLTDINYRGLSETMIAEAVNYIGIVNDVQRDSTEKIQYLNLGGSETGLLHKFKSKFVPNVEARMYYLKYEP